MRFCNKIGVAHSKFLSEWSDDDRAKALAYEKYDTETCPRCGTQDWEWDEEQGGSRYAYDPVEVICHGCERKDWLQDSTKHHPGKYVVLKRPEW